MPVDLRPGSVLRHLGHLFRIPCTNVNTVILHFGGNSVEGALLVLDGIPFFFHRRQVPGAVFVQQPSDQRLISVLFGIHRADQTALDGADLHAGRIPQEEAVVIRIGFAQGILIGGELGDHVHFHGFDDRFVAVGDSDGMRGPGSLPLGGYGDMVPQNGFPRYAPGNGLHPLFHGLLTFRLGQDVQDGLYLKAPCAVFRASLLRRVRFPVLLNGVEAFAVLDRILVLFLGDHLSDRLACIIHQGVFQQGQPVVGQEGAGISFRHVPEDRSDRIVVVQRIAPGIVFREVNVHPAGALGAERHGPVSISVILCIRMDLLRAPRIEDRRIIQNSQQAFRTVGIVVCIDDLIIFIQVSVVCFHVGKTQLRGKNA